MSARVCLSMMAKAEPAVVLAALASARPYVDSVCLLVAPGDPLIDLPLPYAGRVVQHPWQGYAKTRQAALEEAEKDAEWVLTLDTDDRFQAGGKLPELTSTEADAFDLLVSFEGTSQRIFRPHLTRSARGWHFQGIGKSGLHEALYGPADAKILTWDSLVYESGRSSNQSSERYAEDAKLLEIDLISDPTNTRAAFYLAQSYKDSGQHEKAHAAYLRRAQMGGWNEEVFWSLYQAGLLARILHRPRSESAALFQAAHELCPERAEVLWATARLMREEAEIVEARARLLPFPRTARLFVDKAAYASEET